MTIGSILQNALSALQTNQAALNSTSNNIANVNTPGYKRRIVELQPANVGGTEGGVQIADVKRSAAVFLAEQSLNVTSSTARYTAASKIHDSIQGLLGSPSDNSSLSGALDKVFSALNDLSTDPASTIKRNAVLQQLSNLGGNYAALADQLQSIRSNADQQVSATVTQINSLLTQINNLNPQIQHEVVSGGDANGLQDQRDQAVKSLAELMDIRVDEQSNGKLYVTTKDGVPLVTEQLFQLSYTPTANIVAGSSFSPITVQRYDTITKQLVPPATNLGQHIDSGALRGLLDMRDITIPNIADQVGELAAQLADALNAASNSASAAPPPQSLMGRNTGLLGTDAYGFTGNSTFAIVDTTGALVSRVDVDFTNGSYTVDGGPIQNFAGGTIADMVAGINAGLGANGSLSFANGVLTLQAAGVGNGVAVVDDATTPSDRAGHGFAQVFGLNDIVTAARPSSYDTGIAAGDASGFAPGQTVRLVLRGPNGETAADLTYTMTGGTIGSIVSDLNTAGTGLGGYVNFNLDANGKLTAAPTAAFPGYKLEIASDLTNRGGTGVSFSQLFGFGTGAQAEQARGLALTSRVANSPGSLPAAQLNLTPTTVAGQSVLGAGDNRGVLALKAAQDSTILFNSAGGMSGLSSTLGNYAGTVLANAGTEAAQSDSLRDQNQSLKDDVDQRVGGIEGVNLDEELANMLIYQRAYNAAARLITTANDIFNQLLQSVQ